MKPLTDKQIQRMVKDAESVARVYNGLAEGPVRRIAGYIRILAEHILRDKKETTFITGYLKKPRRKA